MGPKIRPAGRAFAIAIIALLPATASRAQEVSPDACAAETERQMTDDERFSLLVSVTADPRLFARFDTKAGAWRLAGGTYKVALGESATQLGLRGSARLQARVFGN